MKNARWTLAALALGSLLLSIFVAEIALRLIAPSNPFDSSFPLYPHRKRRIQIALHSGSRELVQTANSWGLRGDEPPTNWKDCKTIVTVGGSTTQCYYIADAKTWPYQLQQRLRVYYPNLWVGNAGMDGHSTRGHRLVLKEVVAKMHPSYVLFLVGANDLGLSLSTEEQRLYDKPANWRWRLFRISRLAQMIYNSSLILQRKTHHVTPVKWVYRPQPLVNPMPLPSDLTQLLPQLPEFRQNIKTLIAQSRAADMEPIFMTQPILWHDSPEWRAIEGGFYWVRKTSQGHLSAATYGRLQDIYNHALLDTCREEKATCFDLASAIPHDGLYYDDFVHFSEEGCTLVAQKVSDFLRTKL